MRRIVFIITSIFLFINAGCKEKKSESFHLINDLPRSEWIEYAHTKNFNDRINLYDEIYDQNDHPHDTYIARSFDIFGGNEMDILIGKIQSKADFIRYLPIIFSIDRNENYSICESGDVHTLRESIIDMKFYDGVRGVKFSGCVL